MYSIFKTRQFHKSFNKIKRAGKLKASVFDDLEKVVYFLSSDKKLPKKYKDHALRGEFKGYRECHIRPDILLVYQKQKKQLVLVLIDIGSHAKIFG